MTKKLFAGILAAGVSSQLMAGEFGLELGVQKIDVGGSVQYKGTKIDLKKDLGLDDTKTSFKPTLTYLTDNKKHKFLFNYETSSYDETSVLSRNITFNNKVYAVSSSVRTKLKTNWYQLGYRYKFDSFFENKLNISGGLDLNIIDLETSLITTGINESFDETAPLPTAVINIRYDILEYMAVEAKGAFMTFGSYGDYTEYYAGLNIMIPQVKGLSLKTGYMSKDVEVEIESDEKLNLDYSGIYAGLEYKF
ncbi:MAG: hypothetical protein C0626_11210 [Arcobacter sp.]|uniref:hypothetical protein n=1 Tax=uncultured Arcobacter sp. TaxID=165434 RepID=UPI000CBA0106|nr:hypothetical protein [uncultured Arcobacter sp.]PLY09530.1 MAG: hypothetical protein C0626_11210 [Arcobacter sp.]